MTILRTTCRPPCTGTDPKNLRKPAMAPAIAGFLGVVPGFGRFRLPRPDAVFVGNVVKRGGQPGDFGGFDRAFPVVTTGAVCYNTHR